MSTSNGINIGDMVTLDPNVMVALTTGVQFKVVAMGGNDTISIVVTLPNGVSGRLDFVPATGVSKVAQPVNVGDQLTGTSPEPPVGTVLIDRTDGEVVGRKSTGWWSNNGNAALRWTSIATPGHTYEVIAV